MVDDDEVWIGSAINGNANATFLGLLDELAIHRGTVTAEEIRSRWDVDESVPIEGGTQPANLPETAVLYEIFEGMPDGSWYVGSASPTESFTRPQFALVDLPLRYGETGVREDRSDPFLVRGTSRIELPQGPQRLTIRTRGGARVFLDGKKVATLATPRDKSDGHEQIFVPDRSGPAGIRPVPQGDQETVVNVIGDGKRHLVRVEVQVGGARRAARMATKRVFGRTQDHDRNALDIAAALAAPSSTSKTSSSCTVSTISPPGDGFASMAIMARFKMSAAVP